MGWFLHAVETTDGRWTCTHGRRIDEVEGHHSDLEAALAHLRAIALTLENVSELLIHPRGGGEVIRVSVLDPEDGSG